METKPKLLYTSKPPVFHPPVIMVPTVTVTHKQYSAAFIFWMVTLTILVTSVGIALMTFIICKYN